MIHVLMVPFENCFRLFENENILPFQFLFGTSSLATPALAYHRVEHENISNNIDPTLLSIIYIILFLLVYCILDFLLWILSQNDENK